MRQSGKTLFFSPEQLRGMANEVISEPGEWHEYTEALARAFLEADEQAENWRKGMIEQSALRHAAEAGWSRGEHQAEGRAVEAHQEEKHGDA